MSEPDYAKLRTSGPHLDKEKLYPLTEILIVGFTHVLPGPTCTRMFVDAGVRVIHIERKTGDDTRHMGPHITDGSSEYFRVCSAGRKPITLGLKDPKGRALAKEMIAKTDVAIENFCPSVMAHSGFDPEEIMKKCPRLVLASVSGFGQYGPWLKQAAYDIIIQTVPELTDVTGEPNDRPTRVGTSVSDVIAGVMGYSAITTALVAREHTGKGTAIDVSMLDSTLSLVVQDLMLALDPHEVPRRIGNRHPDTYLFDTFDCQDQSIAIYCGNDHSWGLLSHALSHEEWISQADLKTNDLREKNWQKVRSAMQGVFKTKPATEWDKTLHEVDMPAGLVLNVDRTRRLDQAIERGMIKTLPNDDEVLGPPLKYRTWNSYGLQKDAPKLDEQGEQVCKEFEQE